MQGELESDAEAWTHLHHARDKELFSFVYYIQSDMFDGGRSNPYWKYLASSFEIK